MLAVAANWAQQTVSWGIGSVVRVLLEDHLAELLVLGVVEVAFAPGAVKKTQDAITVNRGSGEGDDGLGKRCEVKLRGVFLQLGEHLDARWSLLLIIRGCAQQGGSERGSGKAPG